jgi:parallel beta-helix repeat protein
VAGPFLPPPTSRIVPVASAQEILAAIHRAVPGDIITIAPGNYDITARSIPVQAAGASQQPIYLRAQSYGSVLIQLDSLEGFHVTAPFWVFENLRVRGRCRGRGDCEHALHIVGGGRSFTLRNSEIVDFNAPVKVNLLRAKGRDYYPDHGLLEYNNFYNTAPRDTPNPVTLLDIVAGDGWVVRGNYIADFAKSEGDRISYGAFMKGNGHRGIFERNLVLCEHRLPADDGARVGLSFGGGGTGSRFCRLGNCDSEFSNGTMRNNIIMNCSHDVGIYLNRAAGTVIQHNLLYNNLGIDVRFASSSATISNNIISGRIRNRDNGHSAGEGNFIVADCLGPARADCELSRIYQNPDRGDFRLRGIENRIWPELHSPGPIDEDFCGQPLAGGVNVGPLQYANGIACLALQGTAASG